MSRHKSLTRKTRRNSELHSWQTDLIACLSILSMCYTVFTLFIYREHLMGVLVTVCIAISLMFVYGWIRVYLENHE